MIAKELREIVANDIDDVEVQNRLTALAAEADRLATETTVNEPSAAGPTADRHARAQAALAIGWQHPTDTDLDDYRQWWWAELDRLAAYIRDGNRP